MEKEFKKSTGGRSMKGYDKKGKLVDETEYMQNKVCDNCGGPEAIFTRDNSQLCENCFDLMEGKI